MQSIGKSQQQNRRNFSSQQKRFLFYWQRIAAVLLIPLLIATLGIYFSVRQKHQPTPLFGKQFLLQTGKIANTTSDGTTVWLNSDQNSPTRPFSLPMNEQFNWRERHI